MRGVDPGALVAASAALCLLLVLLACLTCLRVAEASLSALARAHPLSWEAVGAVAAFAFAAVLIFSILLAALALALALLGAALCSAPSSHPFQAVGRGAAAAAFSLLRSSSRQ